MKPRIDLRIKHKTKEILYIVGERAVGKDKTTHKELASDRN